MNLMIKMCAYSALWIGAMCPLLGCSHQAAKADQEPTLTKTLLFQRGDMGSDFWRIPALATTNQGTVIAAADKRNNSNADLPNLIDVVVRRSTDSGLTWSEPQIVMATDEGGGYGDASLGVHRPSGTVVLVAAHGNGLWESTADKHQYLSVVRSTDDGVTWTEPQDITYSLYDPVEGAAPIKAYAGFASSGTMLCDDQGRLMFVLVARRGEEKWGPLDLFVCYSDDAGQTWQALPAVVDANGDESKLAQLADGSLLMSIRNRDKGCRKVARSYDRGHTWTEPTLAPDLVDPACNGDLIALTPAQMREMGLADNITENELANGLLLHSLAYDPAERKNVSVLASRDLGNSWQPVYTIAPEGSGYSALTVMPNGTIGCLTEESAPEGGYGLWFETIDPRQF